MSSSTTDPRTTTQSRDQREGLNRRPSLKNTVPQRKTTNTRISPEPSTLPSASRRSATPYPVVRPPPPNVAVTAEGTAIYDRPPSLEMPRAAVNERRQSRKVSFTDLNDGAESYKTEERIPTRARPSLSVDTSGASSPSRSLPGLSRLPTLRTMRKDRHDSGRDLPLDSKPASSQTSRSTSPISRARADSETARLRAQEDRHLAGLDQLRYQAREQARRDESEARDAARRERHRMEAAAALEGRAETERLRNVEAELAQLEREREAAAARRISRERDQRYTVSEPPMPSSSRAVYGESRVPSRESRTRGSFNAESTSPLSPRRRLADLQRPRQTAVLHQPTLPPISTQLPQPRPTSSSIRDKGLEVIAREQARAAASGSYYNDTEPAYAIEASGRLQDTLDRPRIEERRPEEYWGERRYDGGYVSEGSARREERRRRKENRGGYVWR